MAQPFYARKIDLNIGPRKGETVYSAQAVSYTHLTLPTIRQLCRSRWSPYH